MRAKETINSNGAENTINRYAAYREVTRKLNYSKYKIDIYYKK